MILTDSHETRARAALAIKSGGVVAFRTDTFYGLGVDPFNPGALRKLNALKGRDGKPILVLIGDEGQAARFVAARTRLFDELAARHWPGALTIVADARADLPTELTAGTGKIGVRLPDNAAAREFVRAAGGALTATSANPAGHAPARTAREVEAYFPSQITIVVDGGEATSERPSTVVETTGGRARLLREGVVSREELFPTLRAIDADLDD